MCFCDCCFLLLSTQLCDILSSSKDRKRSFGWCTFRVIRLHLIAVGMQPCFHILESSTILRGSKVQPCSCHAGNSFPNKGKLLPFSKVKQDEWDEWGCLLSDLDKETSWLPNAAHPKQEHVLAERWCARQRVLHNSWLSCSSKHFMLFFFCPFEVGICTWERFWHVGKS